MYLLIYKVRVVAAPQLRHNQILLNLYPLIVKLLLPKDLLLYDLLGKGNLLIQVMTDMAELIFILSFLLLHQ